MKGGGKFGPNGFLPSLVGVTRFWLEKLHLLLMMLSVIVMLSISTSYPGVSSYLRMQVFELLSPLMDSVSRTISQVSHNVHDYLHLKHANVTLSQENALLKVRLKEIESLAVENLHLKTLLNFVGDIDAKYVTTNVTATNIGPYAHSVIIMAGKNSGLSVGQPVINSEGLVGRIVEVGHSTARVLLITDFNSRVPVITQKSRERAIVAGNNSYVLDAFYLPEDSKVRPEEFLMTTGDGKFFPPGIVVGKVKKISGENVAINPVIKINKLDYVSVLVYNATENNTTKNTVNSSPVQ